MICEENTTMAHMLTIQKHYCPHLTEIVNFFYLSQKKKHRANLLSQTSVTGPMSVVLQHIAGHWLHVETMGNFRIWLLLVQSLYNTLDDNTSFHFHMKHARQTSALQCYNCLDWQCKNCIRSNVFNTPATLD